MSADNDVYRDQERAIVNDGEDPTTGQSSAEDQLDRIREMLGLQGSEDVPTELGKYLNYLERRVNGVVEVSGVVDPDEVERAWERGWRDAMSQEHPPEAPIGDES